MNATHKKILGFLSKLSGIILLFVGIYATYEFTFAEQLAFDFMYIYAQTIHVSEILNALEFLKERDMADCLRLLHCHL